MIRRPPRSPPFPSTTLFRSFAFFTFLVHAQRIHELPEHLESRIVEPRLAWPPLAFLGRRGAAQRSATRGVPGRSEEHTSELQSRLHLVCRLLLEKKKK